MEYSDTGELAGWGCGSDLVKGRPRLRENQETYLDRAVVLQFCVSDMPRAQLAEALDDLVEVELVVPKGKHGERVSHCATGTLDEIIRDLGLSMRD
ncbi:hypothetical protein [Streptomyces sp. RKAG337]|uniref:hypothetical protein n=1 Tax=Streptomyces sp. RKAG337 TaxID=2893404 RepID=UPI0020349461|nr:hypothetical protein [Streptomyces sp. RKAG337]MCM2424938.1 hypothetical protein [Streptomyces sp. RKAG337]